MLHKEETVLCDGIGKWSVRCSMVGEDGDKNSSVCKCVYMNDVKIGKVTEFWPS